MAQLVFKLTIVLDKEASDVGGSWQYAGADATETTSGETAKLSATKRVNRSDSVQFPASVLTGTLMFPSSASVPDFITFQGLHDLVTNDEVGSIIAASARFGEYVGGTFSFESAGLRLTLKARPG